MVNNEKYVGFLKSIHSCISHGDYYLVKELSHLELEKMKENEKNIKKDVKRIRRREKQKNTFFDSCEKDRLKDIINKYSKYVERKLEKAKDLEKLKEEMITIEEFVKRI